MRWVQVSYRLAPHSIVVSGGVRVHNHRHTDSKAITYPTFIFFFRNNERKLKIIIIFGPESDEEGLSETCNILYECICEMYDSNHYGV
jgi:hypothetical protein